MNSEKIVATDKGLTFQSSIEANQRAEEAHTHKKFVGLPINFEIAPIFSGPNEQYPVKGFAFELEFEDKASGDSDFMRAAVLFKEVPPSPATLSAAFKALAEACSNPFDNPHVALGEDELTGREISV